MGRFILSVLAGTSLLLGAAYTNPSKMWFTANGSGATKRLVSDKLGDVVSVKDYGAVGDGVTDDTAALATARAAMAASPGTLVFPQGTYKYTASPNWAIPGVRLLGLGVVTLQFNGTGNAVVFDGGAATTLVFNVGMENFTISGTSAATNGLFIRSIHHSYFKNIKVSNVSAAGLLVNFAVADLFSAFRVSSNEGTLSPVPINGILLDARAVGENASANTFLNPIIEGVSGSGIKLVNGIQNTFEGGTSESNGRGIEVSSSSPQNTFINTDLESNSIEDLLVGGSYNSFRGVLSTTLTHVSSTGIANIFTGGQFNSVTMDSGSKGNTFDAPATSAGGSVIDNGLDNRFTRIYDITAGRQGSVGGRTYRDTIPSITQSGITTPDPQELVGGVFTYTPTPVLLSNTPVTAGKPWRVLFLGVWGNNVEGGGLAQTAPIIEATSTSPSFTIGSVTVTVSLSAGNQFQVATGTGSAGFSGRIFVLPYQLGIAGSVSLSLKGAIVTSGAMTVGTKLNAPTGAAGIAGTATLVAGTVTVATTAVTAASVIVISRNSAIGTVGDLRLGAVTAGTSFVISSASTTDTSTVNWWIVN